MYVHTYLRDVKPVSWADPQATDTPIPTKSHQLTILLRNKRIVTSRITPVPMLCHKCTTYHPKLCRYKSPPNQKYSKQQPEKCTLIMLLNAYLC